MTDKSKMIRILRGDPVGTDFLEQPLFVGDVILYCGSWARGYTLKAGLITEVIPDSAKVEDGSNAIRIMSYIKPSINGWRFKKRTNAPPWIRSHKATLKQMHVHTMLWKDVPDDLEELVKQDRLIYIEPI